MKKGMTIIKVLLIIFGSILLSCIIVYIGFKIHTFRLRLIIKSSWMLPLTIRYKGKDIKVECKTTKIKIPDWDWTDGCAEVESNIFYFNKIPALCIVCSFLGSPYAYERKGYDNQPIYPILRRIRKTWNKDFSKRWEEDRKQIKTFY